jgi:hypothetical protein
MIKKTTIETQLECRATASLRSKVADDLSKPDKPMADILSPKDNEDTDESENNKSSSD